MDSDKVKLLDAVVELAMEMDMGDPIDFANLQISEETAHRMIAASIIESTFKDNPNDSELKLMLLATVTHLVVENLVLNQRILTMIKQTNSG